MSANHSHHPARRATPPPEVTEVPNLKPMLRYGCNCHDKSCVDCLCVKAGTKCTTECFCSSYDPNVADLKYLEMEMDDESDPECDKANFPPICGNVFNRFEEFCQLLGVRNPTLCFRASIAKCSSIEISSACTQLKGKRTSKSSIWLFSKIIGLPVPASARDINGQHIQEAVSSAPNDPLFDTVWKLEDWKLKWLVGQREERHDVPKAMHHLLQLAISRGDVYYCFCRSAWQKGGASTHCWACHDCHTERFWSCGKCDKCVPSVHLRCPGCGGASDACERQWLGGKSYGFHGYMG